MVRSSMVDIVEMRRYSPKVILLDRANGVDRRHIGLDTEDLQAQTRSFLNDLVGMVGVLWWHGIRLPLDIGRNVLVPTLAALFEE